MKKILLLALLLIVTACADDANPLDFSTKSLDPEDFPSCRETDCPELEINYLVAQGENAVAKKINSELDNIRIKILANNPDEPTPSTFENALTAFIQAYHQFRADYPKFPAGYEFILNEKIARQSDELVVIQAEHYLFTGGAHGYGATSLNTFSLENGDLLTPKELVTDLPAFTDYVEKKFREKYEIPPNASINSTGFFFENDTFALPENLAILEDEVLLLYNPYEAAAYARGQMKLHIPKSEVRKWLKYE